MAHRAWLYGLVAADALLAFATIGAESVLHKFLPPPLREHQLQSWLGSDWGPFSVFELGVWWASVAAFVLAWIGLATFMRRSRELYLLAWGLTILSLALSGPSVLSAPGAVLDSLGTLVSGALLGLVWLSDLSKRYADPNRDHRASAPAVA